MTQDKDSGEITAMITIEHAGADALKADALLNKYATPETAS
jgi:hypothetical protein